MDGFVLELTLILCAATLFAILARLIKQPMIPAYVISGILIGPIGLKLITDLDIISTFAEFGVALLLFVIGLELDVKKLKVVGGISIFGGFAQVLIVTSAGFIAAVAFGFQTIEAVYIGLILACSSTAVVLKILSDKSEENTLHGRIMLGILLVQDIIVIIAMAFLINLNDFAWGSLLVSAINGFGMVASAFIITKFVLPKFFKKVAESDELLLLFSVSWCFAFVGISAFLSFSLSIGAFIAGVSLANFPYSTRIISKIKPIRNLFVTIFFVSIGMQIVPIQNMGGLGLLAAMLAIVLLLKPIAIMIISSIGGFSKKTSFISGLGLAQISEFSIILASQGVFLGHVSRELLSLVIILAVVTMTLTSYVIKYDYWIYNKIEKLLVFLPRKEMTKSMDGPETTFKNHFVLCGSNKIGRVILENLKSLGHSFVVVDVNPAVIRKLMLENVPCLYGDIEDKEVLDKVNAAEAKAIISTVPNQSDNVFLLNYLVAKKSKAHAFLVASTIPEAVELYDLGATYVVLPKMISGEKFSDLIKHFMDPKILEALRLKQINQLTHFKEDELLDRFAPSLLKYRDKLGTFSGKK